MSSNQQHRNKLVNWMINKFRSNPEAFPSHGNVDYENIFLGVENYLNKCVHLHTVTLATIQDEGGLLTDHGPDHIAMVLRRAEILVNSAEDGKKFDTFLKPYEVFILIMSCHCHDIGNVYGRKGHESRILEVVSTIPDYSKLKPNEWRQIAQIASVHGGTIDGNKDTIGLAIAEGPVGILGQTIRPQLLAAILRLADELADDHTRANDFGLRQNIIPEASVIYHRYAKCLETVRIDRDEKAISLEFVLYPDDIMVPLGRNKTKDGIVEKVFLLDEIHHRTRKTFCELIYCMQFMRSLPLYFDKVRVKLEAFVDPRRSLEPFCTHSYVLRERGYPMQRSATMEQLCDSFDGLSGEKLKLKCSEVEEHV